MRAALLLLAACGSTSEPKPFVDVDKKLARWDEMGIPLIGDIAVKAQLASPRNEYATASGTLTIRCGECFLGDGGKLAPPKTDDDRRAAFFGDGITFPQIALGTITGTVTFERGAGTVDLKAGNPDGVEVTLTGTVKLANRTSDSSGELVLRFRPSEKLREAAPQAHTMLQLTGANRDADGWFNMHIRGTLANMKRTTD